VILVVVKMLTLESTETFAGIPRGACRYRRRGIMPALSVLSSARHQKRQLHRRCRRSMLPYPELPFCTNSRLAFGSFASGDSSSATRRVVSSHMFPIWARLSCGYAQFLLLPRITFARRAWLLSISPCRQWRAETRTHLRHYVPAAENASRSEQIGQTERPARNQTSAP
jgi:hypothetical protein